MDSSLPIRVFLVDDHLLFRMGLRTAFEDSGIEIAGEAGCASEFFDLLPSAVFDVLLLDIVLSDVSGVEVARRLRKFSPLSKILVLSAESDSETVCDLVDMGVDGFISKSVPVEELRRAVECVAGGGEYFGKDEARILNDVRVARGRCDCGFTGRESEIVGLCAQGLSGKEIASRLNISLKTVEAHKNNIFRKLGINNSVELVRYALKYGIVKL